MMQSTARAVPAPPARRPAIPPAAASPAAASPAAASPAAASPAAPACSPAAALAAATPDAGALAALPVAVVVIDDAGRFVSANPAAEQFFQASAPILAQARLADFVPPDSPLSGLVARARSGTSAVSEHDLALDTPRLARSGIAAHAAPMPDDAGHVVLALVDASTARQLDRQLALRNAGRSVAGMAAILAHEVKNPLSGIRGAAQLLEAGLAEADRRLAQLICDEVDRIRALVERLEQFGGPPAAFAPVNINQVLDHVKRLAEQGFARHARFIEALDPSLPPVWGNRDQLVQVLLNLVKNAAEAVPGRGGEITLRSAWQQGVRLALPGGAAPLQLPIVVAVEDNGAGIDAELRAHLFDPFVSGKPGGQGLGLALVARIVGEHAGLVEADSLPGRTTFRLRLAVARPGRPPAQDRRP